MSSQKKNSQDAAKNPPPPQTQGPYKHAEKNEDLHLRVSEKYQVYKDLADRCLINTQFIDKGDKRVFYLRPQENVFLDEPRKQNLFRNAFVKTVSTPPAPEPFTLYADDLYRDLLEQIQDKSCPSMTKTELVAFFKRRQYNLQHKKYKLLLRWSHYALTSELVDKVSLKFSPTYSKVQFELENAVKRQQRLEGDDHFIHGQRPQAKTNIDSLMSYKEEKLEQLSTLRMDDIDVYLRQVTYEQKINREAEKFIQRCKWVPLTHRFEIFHESIEYVQSLRIDCLERQREHSKAVHDKGQQTIEYRKMGKDVSTQLSKIMQHQHIRKHDAKCEKFVKEKVLASSRYDYELPAFIVWNEIELKLQLEAKAKFFGITGDMNIDSGHSFAYNILVFFPTYFQTQVVKSQFAIYDSVPGLIDLQQTIKDKLAAELQRRIKGVSHSKKTSQLSSKTASTGKGGEDSIKGNQFVNSVESSLFGEFNSGQIKDFPSVRIKSSYWIPFICFQPQISKELVYQAAALAEDANPIDECARYIMSMLQVNDLSSVQAVLEGLSGVHFDKVKYGRIRADFLLKNVFKKPEEDSYQDPNQNKIFTEGERSFIEVFSQALKPQKDPSALEEYDDAVQSSDTLCDTPQHLLYSLYMLKYLKAKEHRLKLLYVLNAFRGIQKRITLEMREMGTRDRVMGDSVYIGPVEKDSNLLGGQGTQQDQVWSGFHSLYQVRNDAAEVSNTDLVDVINDELIDIHKLRFNDRIQNQIFSTNPILPRFHTTFGEPLTRQEISMEMQSQKNQDNKKDEGKKLLGRLDTIFYNEAIGYYFVKDDFGKHLMFDSAVLDLKLMDDEILRIVSFYINKQEPILAESDLRTIFPACDRYQLIEEVFECELQYQAAKAELAISYIESFEHITDLLEQQRMVQIIADLMACRPRLNLQSTHFADSYRSEVALLSQQNQIVREIIRMQMRNEFAVNNGIREYLERTYRLVMDQGDQKWQYQKPEGLDQEVKNRENLQKGLTDDGKGNIQDQPKVTSSKFSDPKEFAAYLGIPFSSLQMLMKDHKERDPMVQQTIHEHVSFIKIEEGYPIFMYDMSAKQNNTLQYTSQSERIGMLDFYESLTVLVKVIAAMKGAYQELNDVHRPDNGLTHSALELCTYRYLHAELKMVKGYADMSIEPPAPGLNYLEDDSIVGNSDKMLFYAKEFAASGEDEQATHNPYVLTKLNLKTISNYSFDAFQKLLQENSSLADALNSQDDNLGKRRKIAQHHAYRFFPKLKARAQKIFIPSMLFLTCNSLELLRLRQLLIQSIEQRLILEKVYEKQCKTLRRDSIIYFKDPFNFQTFIELGSKNYVNFVDEGPGSAIELPLAINEFDPSLRSHLNFSDPDSFKMMICPTGLEELRVTLLYELMNLQTLIVATKTNQGLMDNSLRQIAEIDMFQKNLWALANPTYNYYARIQGSGVTENGLKKQAIAERQIANGRMQASLAELMYSIIARKNRNKITVQNMFQKSRPDIADAQEKHEVQLRKLRTYRLTLCQDFCFDVLSEVYCDALKLQLLRQSEDLRRRVYLLPKNQIFLEVGPCDYGEYRSHYNQMGDTQDLLDGLASLPQSTTRRQTSFIDDPAKQTGIQKFWRLPSNFEILKMLESHFEKIKRHDFKFIYQFESKQSGMIPNMKKNSQHKTILQRLPKLTPLDISSVDTLMKNKKRFVDYDSALSFERLPFIDILRYFSALQNLFDLELFQSKLTSNAKTLADLEKSVLSGLPFWEISEEELMAGNSDERTGLIADLGYKNQLAVKVVERMALEKRYKMTLNQDVEAVKDKFASIEKIMTRLELNGNIESAAQFLIEYSHIAYYTIANSLGQVMDKLIKDHTGQKETLDLNSLLSHLTHTTDVKPTYTNGFHVNTALTRSDQIFLDDTSYWRDHTNFMKSCQPVIDEKAIMPNQFSLIQGIFTSNQVNLHTFKKARIYMGKMPKRDYSYLDGQLLNLEPQVRKYLMQHLSSIDSQIKEYLRVRFGASEEVLNISGNADYFFDMLSESKGFLRTFIRSRQLKRIMMIVKSHSLIPLSDKDALQRVIQQYNEEIQWKINTQWDDEQAEKMKAQSKLNNEQKEKVAKAEKEGGTGGITAQQVALVLKQQKEKAMSNAIQQYELAHCEIDVLQKEVHLFLLQTSLKLIDQETAALTRAFELNGKQFEYYIHPCQQFASTVDQKIDKRHHLDPLNKVSFAQKFLTQIRNRCLEIETLTSGVGVVISQKDLNECLEDTCRGIIKYNEVEMRTRCETHAMQVSHFENLLYIKDQQLRSMESKLVHAKSQLDQIISTKVFARGKQLVYELDFTTRQLRLIKDNIFNLETRLNEQVGVTYERELKQTRMELAECRRKFQDYQSAIDTTLTAGVRENINGIDILMRNRAEYFKNMAAQASQDREDKIRDQMMTINIGTLTIKNMTKDSSPKKGAAMPSFKEFVNGEQVSPDKILIGELKKQVAQLQKQLVEFNTLRKSERKAHREIIRLQDLIRKMRLMFRFKDVLIRQKYEHELESLRTQLNSNKQLWNQLAEAERREKGLKADLESTQKQIVEQEKKIESVNSEMRKERIEKVKLQQFKETKTKRLDDLESKARDFEILGSINIPRMVGMLEEREVKIKALETDKKLTQAQIVSQMKHQENQQNSHRKLLQHESKVKTEALSKLENMRAEIQLIEGSSETGLAEIWKDKCKKLIEICKSFKDENEKLQYQSLYQSNWSQNDNVNLQQDHIDIKLQSLQTQLSEDKGMFKLGPRNGNACYNQSFHPSQPLVPLLQNLVASQHLNQSTVLSGGFSKEAKEKSVQGGSHSVHSADRTSKKKGQQQYSRTQALNRITYINSLALDEQQQKDLQVVKKQGSTPPAKNPVKTNFDHESHLTSINYQNLDPVYDPTKNTGILRNYAAMVAMNKNSDNVFSTLKGNTFQNAANLSLQTSGTIMGDYATSNYSQGLSNQANVGGPAYNIIPPNIQLSHPDIIQSRNLATGSSNIFMSSQGGNQGINSFGLGNATQLGTSRNQTYQNLPLLSQAGAGGAGHIHLESKKQAIVDSQIQRAFSNSVVRSRIISPPKILQRQKEHIGMRGGAVFKRRNFADNEDLN